MYSYSALSWPHGVTVLNAKSWNKSHCFIIHANGEIDINDASRIMKRGNLLIRKKSRPDYVMKLGLTIDAHNKLVLVEKNFHIEIVY